MSARSVQNKRKKYSNNQPLDPSDIDLDELVLEGEEIKEDICCLESSGTEDEANIRNRQSTPDQNVRRANLFRSN